MTLFYMGVALGLVLVWMAWKGFLWADKFFMQVQRGMALLACWEAGRF